MRTERPEVFRDACWLAHELQTAVGAYPDAYFKEISMRTLLSIAVLMSTAMPVFAGPTFPVPEPESLALIAVAAVAMIVARRRKK